jgi:hypothetical protein
MYHIHDPSPLSCHSPKLRRPKLHVPSLLTHFPFSSHMILTPPKGDTSNLLIWSTNEAHVTIVCACIAILKPLANRFFPKLLANGAGPYPSIPGKSSKPNGSNVDIHGQSFALQSYRERAEAGQHKTTVTSNMGRALGRRVGDPDADSQESIIGGMDQQDMVDHKEGVFVTRTVHIS